jgi:pyruvate dehydrogenase E2 component (dihydrolipoamide acetyltransferase)
MDILPANMSDTTPAGALAPSWRTHDWAQLSQTVDVGPDRLAYVDIGEGDPPVLLLHGLGGNWTAWLETLPSVALHRRTIAVDLPGFGASAPGSDGISITGYARTIERFCERMGLDEIVLAGSSLGGWVAAELTLRRPRSCAG